MKRIPQEEWENMTREEHKRWHEKRTMRIQFITFVVLYPLFFVLLKRLA